LQERPLGAFLLDVLMFWELAPSGCRQAGYVAPTIRLLHIV